MKIREEKVLVCLAAFVGIALAIWSTHLGPGVGGDATIYLTSAQNLARGIGLGLVQPDGSFRLLPYSAPLFPLILTPFAALGIDLTIVARWLNILLFGSLILLVGFISLKLVESRTEGIFPAWLIACSPVLLPIYSWAMAEPLTMMLGFGGLALVLKNLETKPTNRIGWLEVSGLMLGLSAATRYSAAAYLATGLLLCLTQLKTPFRERLLAVFRMGLVGIIPLSIWIVAQIGQTATVSARTMLTINEMGFRFQIFWPQLNSALLFWLLPASAQGSPSIIGLIMSSLPVISLALLAALTLWVARRSPDARINHWVSALWILAGIYVAILLAVYLTTYPPITIDNRMLSPAHIAFLWIAGLLLIELLKIDLVRPLKITCLVVMVGAIGWYGMRTLRIVRQNSQTGLGYNAVSWRQSAVIAALKAIPESQPLVTNETMAVLYLTGRAAKPVAEIYFDKPVYPFTRYGDGPAGMDPAEAEFKEAKSLLVLFNTLAYQLHPIYGDQTAERVKVFSDGLRVVAFGEDGAMYHYPLDFSNPNPQANK